MKTKHLRNVIIAIALVLAGALGTYLLIGSDDEKTEQNVPVNKIELADKIAVAKLKKDTAEVFRLYYDAAQRGDVESQYHLGVCYYSGEGVELSREESVKWFRKAAEQGVEEAKQALEELEDERKRKEEYARTHGTINGHDYVDLGLSVKWATCNVGASLDSERKADEERERQEAASNRLSTRTFTVNGVSFKMVAVDGGTFTMGATSEQQNPYDDEKPVHDVTLSDYFIGETEVTQALWEAVMGSNPSYFSGSNNPVERVFYDDCITFINKLNSLLSGQLPSGRKFRLPTEAEWEFAARGGNRSRGNQYSGSNSLGSVAWYRDNSNRQTHPVKQKQANELGLYDMSGNVCEWCYDWYGDYSSSSQTNPKGPSSGSHRVLRGGGWGSNAQYCRVAGRNFNSPDDSNNLYGLRLAL